MSNVSNINLWIFYISLNIISKVSAQQLPKWIPYLSHIPEQLNNEEEGFDLNEEDMRKFHIWPSGIIPYYIDDFSFGKVFFLRRKNEQIFRFKDFNKKDKVLRDKIRLELQFINKVTGLRFLELPRPPDDDESRWVFFINRKGLQGCADLAFKNFTNEGVQRVVLGYDCLSEGNLAGIVLAIVGVPPQHNAPNRDNYIKLHKENIMPDKLYLFDILKDNEWLFHDMEYDIRSAGHYLPHQYTSNGGATITMIQSKMVTPTFEPYSVNRLSSMDIKKIKNLYNYISRERASQKVPGCEKLFQPGSNISNFEAVPDNVKPLKKPSKYTGVENTNDQSEEKEIEKNEKSSKGDDKDDANNKDNVSQEENESVAEEKISEEGKVSKEDDENVIEKENKEQNDKNISNKVMHDDDESAVISREKHTLTHLANKKASILDRSDYQTGDEGV